MRLIREAIFPGVKVQRLTALFKSKIILFNERSYLIHRSMNKTPAIYFNF